MRSLFGSDESYIKYIWVNDIASDTWIQPCQYFQCIFLDFACIEFNSRVFIVHVCVQMCSCVCRCVCFWSHKPGAYFCISNHHLCLYIYRHMYIVHSLTHPVYLVCWHHTCLCVHVGTYVSVLVIMYFCIAIYVWVCVCVDGWWFVYLCIYSSIL